MQASLGLEIGVCVCERERGLAHNPKEREIRSESKAAESAPNGSARSSGQRNPASLLARLFVRVRKMRIIFFKQSWPPSARIPHS